YCAYENVPLPGFGFIVPETSASSLCDDVSVPIAEDHISLIKPDGPDHPSIKVLTNALNRLPVIIAKGGNTPDYQPIPECSPALLKNQFFHAGGDKNSLIKATARLLRERYRLKDFQCV